MFSRNMFAENVLNTVPANRLLQVPAPDHPGAGAPSLGGRRFSFSQLCPALLSLFEYMVRRTPLLRLSPVSTFPRLDKLGRYGFGRGSRGLPPGQGIENIAQIPWLG